MKRVFLFVLDSFGIGAAPDAAAFGDAGANTLASLAGTGVLSVPHLLEAGLGNIDGVSCLERTAHPTFAHGRMEEVSRGKDTTVGHWEIAGLVSERPMPTYPDGFPQEVLSAFEEAIGRGVLCNKPYSGTQVIADYGEEHLKTGKPIVYTSADSVFQIAAHEETVPLETLYEWCRTARRILTGEHAVGRVIARPFVGGAGAFVRTANRRDFSLEPPAPTLLDALTAAGKQVISVGKISDIFAGRGIGESHPTHSNAEGIEKALALAERDFEGLCFVNLVDFDMKFGHRRDPVGYARALNELDARLPDLVAAMREDDLLILTADHGCDPTFAATTDHTREYVPLLVYGKRVSPDNLGTLRGFYHVAQRVAAYFGLSWQPPLAKNA